MVLEKMLSFANPNGFETCGLRCNTLRSPGFATGNLGCRRLHPMVRDRSRTAADPLLSRKTSLGFYRATRWRSPRAEEPKTRHTVRRGSLRRKGRTADAFCTGRFCKRRHGRESWEKGKRRFLRGRESEGTTDRPRPKEKIEQQRRQAS